MAPKKKASVKDPGGLAKGKARSASATYAESVKVLQRHGPEIACDDAFRIVNELLMQECKRKQFTVPSLTPCKPGQCQPAELPEIKPCFHLRWGDGPRDQIETDDWEVLCITACNPYSNVTLKNLTVLISVVTMSDGSLVPNLPDGTPSVTVKPTYMVCFGDVPPCDRKQRLGSCVSREVTLKSCGAKSGKYLIKFAYCFSSEFSNSGVDEFKIQLVKS